ncbi:EamA family transporter [Enterococcus florum]|uniref:EamA family transporter n=1 Tax=Enterococcus florum TaxID=2480627 RepID=A0A4P5PI18_9ENTE|nr:DMT family transporter [Enterococcus florum]GCF93033.1 EamA family transporter [Enterococcus florum]
MSLPRTKNSTGHLMALVTILIWGTTFISTKILLRSFTPIEILFVRFVIGYLALLLLYPRRFRLQNVQTEWLFVGAGVSGIALYYLLENIALTFTTASNVGIIITLAPFFTALLSAVFLEAEKPKKSFYLGFLTAIGGVALISFNGSTVEFNPMGDLLALLAAGAWSVYSILTRKISQVNLPTIQTTRRVFLYGIIVMIPMLFLLDFNLKGSQFSSFTAVGNILFLGFGASALCFVTWNRAVALLGAVKTSVYIYLVPVVTVAASVLILQEPLTLILVLGTSLTLLGLWLSQTTWSK